MRTDFDSLKKTAPLLVTFALPCVGNDVNLGECISGIYTWSLTVVGIVAFMQIVFAGWLWLTAFGNTGKAEQARSKISNAILGIVLLFSSYLILRTINPDLVRGTFNLPKIDKEEALRNTGGVNDLTKIEAFDVNPKVAYPESNTPMAVTLKIFASVENIDKICGIPRGQTNDQNRDMRYRVRVRSGGAEELFKESHWKASEFGTGTKSLEKSFELPISQVNLNADRVDVADFIATFECYTNSSWLELNRANTVSVSLRNGPPVVSSSLAKIEAFDVNPKTADSSADTELTFSTRIFASVAGFEEACRAAGSSASPANMRPRYRVFFLNNPISTQLGQQIEESLLDKNAFRGNDSAISFSFKKKIGLIEDPSFPTAEGKFYATFDCVDGGRNPELDRSSLVPVRITN